MHILQQGLESLSETKISQTYDSNYEIGYSSSTDNSWPEEFPSKLTINKFKQYFFQGACLNSYVLPGPELMQSL